MQKLKNISFESTTLENGFWKSKYDVNKNVSIGNVYRRFEETGRFNAMRFARKEGEPVHVFYDSVHPIAVVHNTEDGVYYGWLDAYSFLGSDGQERVIRFYLRETSYCTCLNYPLKWGEK